MKILYVTTIGLTMNFFRPFIKELKMHGHQIDIACNDSLYPVAEYYKESGCNIYTLSCTRSPYSTGVYKAIKKIKQLVEKEKYDIVHCHTPIAAMCTRFACTSYRKKGLRVIYTAHGFHFYKGAPLKNWLIYYPIEKICSCFTDTLITINQEDYTLAKRKLKAKEIICIPGVGIDVKHFSETAVDSPSKRAELGVGADSYLLLSVGELNENKNHESVVRAIAELNDKSIQYMIAGEGSLKDYLIDLSEKLGVREQIHLLGRRNDVAQLYKTANAYVHPSFREGLPVAVMEALASGTPIICTDIRGNTDIVKNNRNGIVVKAGDVEELTSAIEKVRGNSENLGYYNSVDAQVYDISIINDKMLQCYFKQENFK